jgi:PTH1 family peptidyl-tRNA hydrolase
MQKFLIIGLGNIGAEYAHTRHNIGFDVADVFVRKHAGSWRVDRFAEVSEIKLKSRTLVVIKPTTFMNLSGRALRYWMDKEKIPVERTLTVVDDLAITLDKIRLRSSGSHAGHNGLKDIEATLGNNLYPRLRFGIGNDFPKGRQIDFVLAPWAAKEVPVVNQKISTSVDLIEDFALMGLDFAMNKYNKLSFEI